MPKSKMKRSEGVREPSLSEIRRLFRTSARALLANRPLGQMATSASESAVVLSEAELDAVEEVALVTKPWVGAAAHDRLTRTIVDYMALIETSLSTAEAAAMLRVGVSRIRQRIRGRSLFGVEYEGRWRLPRFQFERRKVLPGLAEVLAALPPGLNPLDVAAWFLEPNVDLEADEEKSVLSPRAWLLRGGAPSTVARLARHL